MTREELIASVMNSSLPAAEMLRRDGETIADLRAELDSMTASRKAAAAWGELWRVRCARAVDELAVARAELAECISALKKIANPIDAMQRELPDGARLNGAMATALANDPNYLRDVAKTILQNHAARKGEGE